jgi:hypothetical protein
VLVAVEPLQLPGRGRYFQNTTTPAFGYIVCCALFFLNFKINIVKPLLSDFQKYMSIEDMLCIKTIVDIDFKEKFIENKIYSPIRVYLETSGKYDDEKRAVYVDICNGLIKCEFVEYGLNAEQIIFDKLKSCFIPMSTVISVFRETMATTRLK